MRRGAASRSSLRAPPPFNKRPPVRRGSGSGGWLAGREGSGVPHAPASWVWATARCQPRSCLGVHAGLGRGSPSLELRPPLGHTALSPRPAGHELKHPTACTQALGEMGWPAAWVGLRNAGHPTHWLGALRCSGWALLPALLAILPLRPGLTGLGARSGPSSPGRGDGRCPASLCPCGSGLSVIPAAHRGASGRQPSALSPECGCAPGGQWLHGAVGAQGQGRGLSGRAPRAGRPPGSRRCAGTCT